jgi:hypothetical protein
VFFFHRKFLFEIIISQFSFIFYKLQALFFRYLFISGTAEGDWMNGVKCIDEACEGYAEERITSRESMLYMVVGPRLYERVSDGVARLVGYVQDGIAYKTALVQHPKSLGNVHYFQK